MAPPDRRVPPTTAPSTPARQSGAVAHGEAHAHGEACGCDHARQRADSAMQGLADAETACRSAGLRLTPIRRAVLGALLATHRPLGAYDIADALASTSGKRFAPITVYRALDFLLEQGFAHRLESRNAFIACPHRHRPDEPVVFLICETCGGIDEASDADVLAALDRLAASTGFAAGRRVIEMSGRCAHCQ